MTPSRLSRRDIFRFGGGALALNSISAAKGQTTKAIVRGRIINADDGSGLPGVRVSNGRDIALTGPDGEYALAYREHEPVFVIKPAGWSPELDKATLIPKFHANPSIASSIDFALKPAIEPDDFKVLMFADPQPGNDVELGYLRTQLANGLPESSAAFGITLGDLVGDNLALFDRYNKIIGQIGLPWWNLPGNHDLDFSAPSSMEARAPWRRAFGPTTYAFEYGMATFVMIDNINWHGKMKGPNPYSGMIGADNLSFIESLLKTTPRDRLVVLCMHIPLISACDPNDPGSNTSDRDALLSLIEGRPCVSFAGHMHTTEHHYLKLPKGGQHHHHILTALSGSWWSGPIDALGQPVAQSCDGSPNGWHILHVDGQDYSTEFVSTREMGKLRVMIVGDHQDGGVSTSRIETSCIAQSALKSSKILVNVFDGGPRTRVEACVAGCSPSAMARAVQPDPLTRDLFLRAGATKKPWVQAEPSSHIWQADLPSDLRAGSHRLNVYVRNEYGAPYHGALIFEILEG